MFCVCGVAGTGYLGLIKAQKSDGSWLLDVVASSMAPRAAVSFIPFSFAATSDSKSGDNAAKAFAAAFTELVGKLKCEENKAAFEAERKAIVGTVFALAVLDKSFAAKKSEWCAPAVFVVLCYAC